MKRLLIALVVCIGILFCSQLCTYAEESESGSTTEQTLDQSVMDNVNGNLKTYWADERAKISIDGDGGFIYKMFLSISLVCRKSAFFIIPVAIIVGLLMTIGAGMHKPLKRAGLFVLFGVPALILFFALGIPIMASIFYYGKDAYVITMLK